MSDRRWLLAIGDLIAFTVFGVIGLLSHEKSVTLETAARAMLPFPLVWFLIAPWLGAFSAGAQNPGLSFGRTFLIWLPAGTVALVGRAVIFDRELFNAFFVIALLGNGLFLAGWRAIYKSRLTPSDDAPAGGTLTSRQVAG
jgi:hypothetical protein